MSNAKLDENSRATLTALSNANDGTIVDLWADPVTHRLLIDLAGDNSITVGTTTVSAGTTTRILYDNAGVVGEYTISGSGTSVAMSTAPTFATSITGSYLTASQILITDSSKNIISAAVATYPSLTELSYVKGVTSSIQTQLNARSIGGSDTQVQFNDGGSFGGSANLTFLKTGTGKLTVGGVDSSGTTGLVMGGGKFILLNDDPTNNFTKIYVQQAQTSGGRGTEIDINAGNANVLGSAAAGGSAYLIGGDGWSGSAVSTGGYFLANGGQSNGDGGPIFFVGGGAATGSARNGGNVSFQPGVKDGAGTNGKVYIQDASSFINAILDTSLLSSSNKTFSFPNKTGTFALTNTAPTSLFDHYINAGNVTTGETDLYSDTIAASQLGANGDKLEAEYGGVFVSSATATREIKVYFGGTVILDTGTLTLTLSSAWTAYVSIIRVSATVVRYMVSLTTEGAALAAYTAVGEVTGLTLSNTNILKITGQAASTGAATNDIVAKLGNVVFVPAA